MKIKICLEKQNKKKFGCCYCENKSEYKFLNKYLCKEHIDELLKDYNKSIEIIKKPF